MTVCWYGFGRLRVWPQKSTHGRIISTGFRRSWSDGLSADWFARKVNHKMNGSTTPGVAVSRKLHELLTAKAHEHGVGLEAFVHSLLLQSLVDAERTQSAAELARYFGNAGASRLDTREL